jgi:hypothetical protein
MSNSQYASVPQKIRSSGINKLKRALQYTEDRPMKLTFKQRLRNWLLNDENEFAHSIAIDDCVPNFQSQGFRLNIYGASGGTIVETTKYDRKHDENRNSLHIITDDKDLGEELGKIITMEQLR